MGAIPSRWVLCSRKQQCSPEGNSPVPLAVLELVVVFGALGVAVAVAVADAALAGCGVDTLLVLADTFFEAADFAVVAAGVTLAASLLACFWRNAVFSAESAASFTDFIALAFFSLSFASAVYSEISASARSLASLILLVRLHGCLHLLVFIHCLLWKMRGNGYHWPAHSEASTGGPGISSNSLFP